MAKETKHTVKKGETLTKIGKKYGADPDAIFNDKANAKLKKERGKPDKIQPGDVVIITKAGPDKKQLAKMLKSIEAQRDQRAATIKELETSAKEMKARFADTKKKYKKKMDGIQMAEMIVMIHKDMAKIGVRTMKVGKGADAIAKANKAHVKDIVGMFVTGTSPATTAAANKAEAANMTAAKVAGKSINAYFNLTSPSFYGSRIAVLKQDGFFKKVLSGNFEGTGQDLLDAYNWDLGKELDKSAKEIDKRTADLITEFKKADDADVALITEIKAQMK